MIDIIESDLLKVHMPSVSYLRLDGSIPAGEQIIHRLRKTSDLVSVRLFSVHIRLKLATWSAFACFRPTFRLMSGCAVILDLNCALIDCISCWQFC